FAPVVTTLVGYLAARPERDGWLLIHLLCGTALAAGGAATLNQWMERRTDALMRRTKDRPIPSGQVTPVQAFAWGVALSIAGTAQLSITAGPLAAALAAATILSYILLYTPLKRRTRWATEVGAVSGALPPLIGWAAARGTIDGLGWGLFALLFFWQIPHFLAIAWTYRRDYEAADFPMLPVVDGDGRTTAWWSLINTIVLAAATITPAVLGQTGWLFGAAAIVLGAAFVAFAAGMLRADERNSAARRLFFYSIFYLPALLAVLVVDRWLA
ncbi:MAG: protoheme IX farnesyltransferase, partial [Opitutaceae bacterium]|nr:protoheme IX farnesyltransferase [Opitutaceae bacterium]